MVSVVVVMYWFLLWLIGWRRVRVMRVIVSVVIYIMFRCGVGLVMFVILVEVGV